MAEEESVILKIFRDPLFPKIIIAFLSLVQFLILGLLGHGSDTWFQITINFLTFVSSLVVIGIISAKKTEQVAKKCFYKCLNGNQECTWNGIYHAYAIVFGSLNVLTVSGNIIFNATYSVLAVLGMFTAAIYYTEAYSAFEKINIAPVEEASPRRFYYRFLKFIGRFPKLMRLVVLALSIAYIVLCACFSYDKTRTYYVYARPHYYYQLQYYRYGGEVANMIYVMSGLIIFISLVDILVMHVTPIWNAVGKIFGANFLHYGMRYTLALAVTTFSFVGSTLSLINGLSEHIIATICLVIVFVLALFMTFAENYTKSIESGRLSTASNNKSILPKNLAKDILNPVTLDVMKSQIQEASPDILGGYDTLPFYDKY